MNEQNSCLSTIKYIYNDLSEKDKLIADYILNDPNKVVHGTIYQIAEDLGVAEATVFRFCKRLGYKGYQAMKIALASEISNPTIQDFYDEIEESDDEAEVTQKVFRFNIKTLEDTLRILDKDKIKQAVNIMKETSRIDFYGSGGSGTIALDAYHKFVRTGINTNAYLDTHFQIMAASQLKKGDVVVLISHSGVNRDMLDILEIAKENEAITIGITGYAKTPLSEQVDIPLYTVSEETEYRSEALASRLAQLTIIDALFVNFMKARKEETQQALQKIRKAISLKKL